VRWRREGEGGWLVVDDLTWCCSCMPATPPSQTTPASSLKATTSIRPSRVLKSEELRLSFQGGRGNRYFAETPHGSKQNQALSSSPSLGRGATSPSSSRRYLHTTVTRSIRIRSHSSPLTTFTRHVVYALQNSLLRSWTKLCLSPLAIRVWRTACSRSVTRLE
jgi:hypothetical protein